MTTNPGVGHGSTGVDGLGGATGCVGAASVALGTVGTGIPLAILACESTIVDALDLILPDDWQELVDSGTGFVGLPDYVIDGIKCITEGKTDIKACVDFLAGTLGNAWGAIADYIDEHFVEEQAAIGELTPEAPPPPPDPTTPG